MSPGSQIFRGPQVCPRQESLRCVDETTLQLWGLEAALPGEEPAFYTEWLHQLTVEQDSLERGSL